MLNRFYLKNALAARPLFWLIIAFVLGIAASCLCPERPVVFWAMVVFVFFALGLFIWRRNFVCLLLVFLLFGAAYYLGYSILLDRDLPVEAGCKVDLFATVVENASEGNNGFYFTVDPVSSAWPGKLLVYAEEGDWQYGQMVKIVGTLAKDLVNYNTGGFNYTNYLQNQGIVGSVFTQYGGSVTDTGLTGGNLFMRLAQELRSKMEAAMAKLPGEEASLLKGIIFGDKSGLEDSDKLVLSQTGIMHVFAASGLHVGYVVLLGQFIVGIFGFGKWKRFTLITALVLFYGAMVGFTPSILRAAVMTIIGLFAYTIKEEKDFYTAWAVAAFVCLLYRPGSLFEAGFQMSFAAVWGVVILGKVFSELLHDKMPAKLKSVLSVTLGAQLAVMPLVGYYFNVLTLAGFLLSPLACVLAGMVVVLGLISAPFALIGFGNIPLYGAGLLADLMKTLADWIAFLPGAWCNVVTPSLFVLLIYFVILLFLPYTAKIFNRRGLAIEVLILFLLLLLPSWQNKIDGYLEITFLDVGQGDSAYISTPLGQDILVDAGGSTSNLVGIGNNVVLPFLRSQGVSDLELAINSHPHEDHAGGLLAVFSAMPVEYLLTSDVFDQVPLQDELVTEAENAGAEVLYVQTGQVVNLEPGLSLEILWPPAESEYDYEAANDGSLVFRLNYYQFSVLFCGDLAGDSLTEILTQDVAADILKQPHHGSGTDFVADFYEAVDPKIVIISVGRDNSYGHPADNVINYWVDEGVFVYRTDQDGAISIKSDGTNWQVSTFK